MAERKTPDLCRAGGRDGQHPNYGLPHVIGAIYWWTKPEPTWTTSCVFCGKEIQ